MADRTSAARCAERKKSEFEKQSPRWPGSYSTRSMPTVFLQVREERRGEIALTRRMQAPVDSTLGQLKSLVAQRLADLPFLAEGLTVDLYEPKFDLEYELDPAAELTDGVSLIVQPSYRTQPLPQVQSAAAGRRPPVPKAAAAGSVSLPALPRASSGPGSPGRGVFSLTATAHEETGRGKDDAQLAAQLGEKIQQVLEKNMTRVMDVFKEWDADGNGQISVLEFRAACRHLDLPLGKEEVEKIFSVLDPDGSGSLSFKELNRALRSHDHAAIDARLQPGAAGAVTLEAKTKHAIRKAPKAGSSEPRMRKTSMRAIDLDESEGARPVHEQLRDAISAQAVRVIELFREWDGDGDGTVSKKEVRRSISPPRPA